MKEAIRRICGHIEVAEVFSSDDLSDTFKELSDPTKALCTECQREKDYQKAIIVASGRGWYGLKGSEKQEKWAYAIRNQMIHKINSLTYNFRKDSKPEEHLHNEYILEHFDRLMRWLGSKDRADWWIQRKNFAWNDYSDEMIREQQDESLKRMRHYVLVQKYDLKFHNAICKMASAISDHKIYSVHQTTQGGIISQKEIVRLVYSDLFQIAIFSHGTDASITQCNSEIDATHRYLFKHPSIKKLSF